MGQDWSTETPSPSEMSQCYCGLWSSHLEHVCRTSGNRVICKVHILYQALFLSFNIMYLQSFLTIILTIVLKTINAYMCSAFITTYSKSHNIFQIQKTKQHLLKKYDICTKSLQLAWWMTVNYQVIQHLHLCVCFPVNNNTVAQLFNQS